MALLISPLSPKHIHFASFFRVMSQLRFQGRMEGTMCSIKVGQMWDRIQTLKCG